MANGHTPASPAFFMVAGIMKQNSCASPWAAKSGPSFLLATVYILLQAVHIQYTHAYRSASIASSCHSLPSRRRDTAIFQSIASDEIDADAASPCSISTNKLTTASGKSICRYALGGAARSVQSEYIPLNYRDLLSQHAEEVAPFYFYYNPHRYPAFLSGVSQSFENDEQRRDMFFVSGGTERSAAELDERLNDALAFCGGDYLDGFVLEYVCPYELESETQLDPEMRQAVEHLHELKQKGKIRYVMASTHSHQVGSVLASTTLPSDPETLAFDALMLRYSMSHKVAAESLSFPIALKNNIPVLAFTTTRWNRLQIDSPSTTNSSTRPTSADCLKFALHHPAVEVVLHSAREEEELEEALLPLFSSSLEQLSWLSEDECTRWRVYGNNEMEWNEDDGFDEYPEESVQ